MRTQKKYKTGHKHTRAKHSYFKNNATTITTLQDLKKEYPQIKISRNLKARVAHVTSWEIYENMKQSGNNWKDNSKKKHQYLRHTK